MSNSTEARRFTAPLFLPVAERGRLHTKVQGGPMSLLYEVPGQQIRKDPMDFLEPNAPSSIRQGLVLDTQNVECVPGQPTTMRDFEGCIIGASVPSSLLLSLGGCDGAIKHRFDVLAHQGGGGSLALFTVQAGGAQLRVLMPLSAPSVQRYLRECVRRQMLRLLLGDEDSRATLLLGVPGNFADKSLFERLLREASARSCDADGVLALCHELADLGGVRTLVPGLPVTDVVAVLVAEAELAGQLDLHVRPTGSTQGAAH